MPGGAQRLARAQERAALEYLSRSPYENVFLSWLIASDRSLSARSSLYVHASGQNAVTGVAFFGRQIVLAADGDAALDAFAEVAAGYRFERMIVGSRPVVERYWERIRRWHAPPKHVRKSQPVFVLHRGFRYAGQDNVRVRKALPHEWETVAGNSAEMIQSELEYDPRARNAEFNANVRIMIDRGLWWVGEWDGELCFFCNCGPRSSQTLQLQGIWTPQHLRGRGLATQALAGVCAELLRESPSVSLYVNEFNEPALRLYKRVGFERAGELQTLLF